MEIVIDKKENISLIKIEGDFFISNVIEFETCWEKITENNPAVIALDCKNISFIDSTAVGTLVQFMKYLANRGVKLILLDLSMAVDTIFKATRLDKFFTITTREKLALEYGVLHDM